MRSERFDTPEPVRLFVRNPVGSVRVSAHAEPATEVKLFPAGGSDEEIDRLIAEARVELVSRHDCDEVLVEVVPPRRDFRGLRHMFSDHGIDVTVRAPSGSDLEIETASAEIEIDGSFADVTCHSASGAVTIADASGNLRAQTASGSVRAASVTGAASVKTAAGSVRLGSVSGAASVSTASGSISVDEAMTSLQVESVSGRVEVGSLGGDCRVKTVSGSQHVGRCTEGKVDFAAVSGSIVVGIAEGSAVHVDASAVSGSLESEIPLSEGPPDGGSEHELDLAVRTVSGSARIVRAGATLA